MRNARFSTALHIMTLLTLEGEGWLTSTYLAGSINVDPAVVRKEIIHLRAAGLVESKEGKNGGVKLARPASGIRLSEIFLAIEEPILLAKAKSPNPACLVGKQINLHLEGLFSGLNEGFLNELRKSSLAAFVAKFR